MRNIVEHIITHTALDWKGEFMALEDHVKDSAISLFLRTEATPRLLSDIFPPCCNGAEVRVVKELYCNPGNFRKLYFAMMTDHDMSECFESEAIRVDESLQLSTLIGQDGTAFAELWGDIIYRYCEDILRDACARWFNYIQSESNEARRADMALQDAREMAL